ncbi:MAG: DUF3786 domain-containing protein [Deltaproteobacteria bacterium]|nr:DUF3786 domain-containing protein [Deltaproteobacteria bacterium]
MLQLNNPMDILKLLDKSNCRECGYPTCLAFAAAVARGQKRLDECPRLDKELTEQFKEQGQAQTSDERDMENIVAQMKGKMKTLDLQSAAKRLEVPFSNNIITIRVLGKNVYVDAEGKFSSEIHLHHWIIGPILNYIIHGAGRTPTGEWISFRELKDGMTWYNFFLKRCEKPLKKVADTYPDLFHDMLYIFNGKQVENHYQSDISLVLLPLPKLPILVCYWKPEDGLGSSLNLFFDVTASENLPTESIYTLCTGLVIMFEKIALRHGGG